MAEGTRSERRGLFGVETEYAILYLPGRVREERGPPFEIIEEVIFESLLAGRKAAISSGLKGGYFLENGGLVHLEVFLRTQADTPILEAATPECRSPRDLLVYQRAFDEMLAAAAAASRPALERKGYQGRIAFGKNNRDVRGVGYGCHENYLVYEETRLRERVMLFLAAPLLTVLLLPSLLFLFLVLAGVVLGSLLLRVFPEVVGRLMGWWLDRFPQTVRNLRAVYFLLMNTFLFVPIALYSLLLRKTAFQAFQKDLTSFLVTRQILAGAGGLDLRNGRFEIAQRPRLTSSLGEIVMFGRHKTMFDLKGLLYDPLALFRPQRKLTVTLGDSNLSDLSFYLKVGTTALLIEMIEAGNRFTDLRLRRPVRAFQDIAAGGPWKELEVYGPGGADTPGRLTAIEIQREYLRRAREHFAARPAGRVHHQEILALWEQGLQRLADTPAGLADSLDWAAKKALLDRAVFSFGTWKEFLAWGRILGRAGRAAVASSRSLDEVLSRSSLLTRLRLRSLVRRAVRRGEVDPARFLEARDLFWQAQKIDLRYHEIGEEPGYARELEAEGLLRRLTTTEEVARAMREPPPDTRARIRGYYISLGQTPDSVRVNWNEVEITGTARSISLADPFQYRIPTD